VPEYHVGINGVIAPAGTVADPLYVSGGGSSSATSATTNGTIATANTYQSILAANASRKGCLIVNNSAATEYVYLGAPGSATLANSIPVPQGGTFSCNPPGVVLADQISMTSGTVGASFVAVSQ